MDPSSTYYAGCAGDVYVSGNYSTPLTIGAANNVVISGNLTTTRGRIGNPTGSATLGLVANEFVRVMHGCSSNQLSNPTIDAAILALNHSFIVDNYNCGGSTRQPDRPRRDRPVLPRSGRPGTRHRRRLNGYAKNYNYDDRLANILPPYLFDISNSGLARLARDAVHAERAAPAVKQPATRPAGLVARLPSSPRGGRSPRADEIT